MHSTSHLDARPSANESFRSLLYRFFFFDWLFADLSKTTTLLERHAGWQHNREMRKYLPTYLQRWGVIATTGFLVGLLSEKVFEATLVAAFCFTGVSLTVPVMVVILVVWIFLAKAAIG